MKENLNKQKKVFGINIHANENINLNFVLSIYNEYNNTTKMQSKTI